MKPCSAFHNISQRDKEKREKRRKEKRKYLNKVAVLGKTDNGFDD